MNDRKRGQRLLVAGSIAHKMMTGDLLCGVGAKTTSIPKVDCKIVGLRGPITYEVFKKAGYHLRDVQFLKDPGLLIRFMIDPESVEQPRGAIFIPHYRERYEYLRNPVPDIQFVDIDNDPLSVARSILGAELVYTSSLHGVVFSHALRRPCVLVNPQTVEPTLKYEDYFASVDVPWKRPLDNIHAARRAAKPDSPDDVVFDDSDFAFPSIDELRTSGIAQ